MNKTKKGDSFQEFVDRRILDTEKSFIALKKELFAYARRTAKLRNNGDEISSILRTYATELQHNPTTKLSLFKFCDALSNVEDLHHMEFEHFKNKVHLPVSEFADSLKKVKTDVRKEVTNKNKEIALLRKSIQSQNSLNYNEQAKAKNGSLMAQLESRKHADKYEVTVNTFEEEKLKTLEASLKSFVSIEILWHMRALEHYTNAYNALNEVSVSSDLSEFQNQFQVYMDSSMSGGTMGRAHSTQSLFNPGTTTGSLQQNTGLPPTKKGDLMSKKISSSHGDIRNVGIGSGQSGTMRNSVHFESSPQKSNSLTINKDPVVNSYNNSSSAASSPTRTPNAYNNQSGLIHAVDGQPVNANIKRQVNSFDYDDDDEDEHSSEFTAPSTTEPSTSVVATNRSKNKK